MSTAEDLLDGLDPEQRDVATALRGAVSVVAGAGTGKTRAITHRMAYGIATGVYKPSEILAVTFTVRAANEMRERLTTLGAPGVQARTFHSAALRQLRYFWPKVYGGDLPNIIDSKYAAVAEAARRIEVRGDRALIRDLAAEVEWAKVSQLRPDDYARTALERGRQVGDLDPGTTAAVLSGYEDLKRERQVIDLEDILLLNAAILADEPRAAAEVRRLYRWFVVDEFQDVNPLQATLLDLWLGGRDDVCVVGDPRQTIFTFAGASPRLLERFTATHPDAQRIELVRNYRSTPQIVDAANTLFPAGASTTVGVRLQSQQEPGPAVQYVGHDDEPAEAAAVARAISDAHAQGVDYRDMAILYRINVQSEAYEEALSARSIPYVMRGGEGFFRRAEVRQAVTLLRGAAMGQEPGASLQDDVRAVLSSMGHSAESPSTTGAVRDRWESLQGIISMSEDLVAERPTTSMTDLVADLDRRAELAHAPTTDGVTMATLHSAKGLEWDAVFVVGAHDGMLPIVHAREDEAIEEERRLFYVGLTRAKTRLMVTWARARKPGGKAHRRPSRFLDRLTPEAARERVSRDKRAPRCRVCNTELAVAERRAGICGSCPSDYDAELFEELRQWRLDAAEGKPAFTVFTDATLRSLSQVKPRSRSQLSEIPGVGPAKLERYADSVLEVIGKSG